MDLVNDGRCRRDEIKIVLALKSLSDDVEVQKAEEPAAEAEAQRRGVFRLVLKGGVVQLKLLERVPKVRIAGGIRRVNAAVDHRLRLLVAREGLRAGVLRVRDRVADTAGSDFLDGGGHVADVAGPELLTGDKSARTHEADLDDLVNGAGRHHFHLGAALHHAVHHAAEDDDTAVGVIERVENEGLERCIRVSGRSRELLHDLFQHRMDILTGLG